MITQRLVQCSRCSRGPEQTQLASGVQQYDGCWCCTHNLCGFWEWARIDSSSVAVQPNGCYCCCYASHASGLAPTDQQQKVQQLATAILLVCLLGTYAGSGELRVTACCGLVSGQCVLGRVQTVVDWAGHIYVNIWCVLQLVGVPQGRRENVAPALGAGCTCSVLVPTHLLIGVDMRLAGRIAFCCLV